MSQKEDVGLMVVVAEEKTGAYSDPHPHLHPLTHPHPPEMSIAAEHLPLPHRDGK